MLTCSCQISLGAALLVTANVLATPRATEQLRIYVDPEVRISYDGNVSHMEAPVAASATDPNLLYASAQLAIPGRRYGTTPPQLYYSRDGGVNWNPVTVSGTHAKVGSWDSSIAAGKESTAYFITRRGEIFVYRTQDGGETWDPTPTGNAWDRPYSVVDNTDGPNAGRLYIAGEKRSAGSEGVHVMSSSDGGKTFGAPVLACKPPEGWHAATAPHPVVLSDGTLVVRCNFYPADLGVREQWHLREIGVVVSTDGGKTFSQFRRAGHVDTQLSRLRVAQFKAGDLLSGGVVTAMAVASSRGAFADRLYIALASADAPDRQSVYLIHSDDRGVTWSERRAVDLIRPPVEGTMRQGVPMLAVNQDGIVGIAWFDSRNVSGGRGYDIYFTASLDGGESFRPAQRVTSSPSHPREGGASIVPNFSVDPPGYFAEVKEKPDGRAVMFASPYNVRWLGGDFSTMAVDAAGRFHPMWPDARSGTWQLYTSTIRVAREPDEESPPVCALDASMKLILGEPQWNESAGELSVPVQLQNVSQETFVSPVRLTLETLDNPAAARFGADVLAAFPAARLLQTQFEYAISRKRPLFPNGVTETQSWRMHVARPEEMTSTIRFKIQDVRSACASTVSSGK